MRTAKILIADGDSRIVELAVIKLSNAGYWVTTCANGEETLEKIRSTLPDLLLFNPALPAGEGDALSCGIHNSPEFGSLPVIWLMDPDDDVERLKNAGVKAEDVLVKPFTPKTLLQRVNARILQFQLLRKLNPLTALPGKVHLQERLSLKNAAGEHFDLIFVDLKDFRVYNQYYGFEQGDRVIRFLAELLAEAGGEFQSAGPELYHLGGDDFCILLAPGRAEDFCETVRRRFDSRIGQYYLEEDRSRGGLVVCNRRGYFEQWPVMSIAFGILSNEHRAVHDWLEAEQIGSELLGYAKTVPGSNYLRDRRRS